MPSLNLTAAQVARLKEYFQEVKDCHTANCTWTHQEWCDYCDEWINETNGYILFGGVRPTRPHA